MSCETTMSRLVELPTWRFSEVRHLAECAACREAAAAIESGQQALADDIEAFVEGGDFDAVFTLATAPPQPVARAPRLTGLHGRIVALAAAAVLVVAGFDTPLLQPLLPDWNAPTASDEELLGHEGADEIGELEDGDLTSEEWHAEAYQLASEAMRYGSGDPAAFELWLGTLRAAELGDAPQLADLALERAAFLGVVDPGLLWLVEDPELRDRLTVPPVAVAVVADRQLVQVGGTLIRGESRLVNAEGRVPVSIHGESCGAFAPERRMVVRAAEGTVEVDDRGSVPCGDLAVADLPDPVQQAPLPVGPVADAPAVPETAVVEVHELPPAVDIAPPSRIEGPVAQDDGGDESAGDSWVYTREHHPDCDVLDLELRALVGRLKPEEIGCLEGRLASAERQTQASKVSRVLLANAMAVGDDDRWRELAGKHLEDYGFDPDLAYLYARAMFEVGRYRDAAHWADAALQERDYWSGFTHVQRVDQCHHIKVYALQKLWLRAVDATSWDPLPSSKVSAQRLRLEVKTAAREWFDYAEAAGISTERALAVCASAAGSEDACQ